MNKKKSIIFFVNHLAFFVSHRLPIAKKLLKSSYDVKIICGQYGNFEMENQATLEIEKCKMYHTRAAKWLTRSKQHSKQDFFGVWKLVLTIYKPKFHQQ